MSHDRRYLAIWSRMDSLGVWDLRSDKRLWIKQFSNGDRCVDWRFSPDDRFLEATPGRAPAERRIATATGDETPLPRDSVATSSGNGYSPSDQHENSPHMRRYRLREAASYTERTPSRNVVARSADGAATAAIGADGDLVIERGGRCSWLGVDYRLGDPVMFSPDGFLYASHILRGTIERPVSEIGTVVDLWRSDTGTLVRSLHADYQYKTFLMPSVGRVAFGAVAGGEALVGNTIHVVDAFRGQELGVVRPPVTCRMRQPDAMGTRWFLDDSHDIQLWDVGDPLGPRPIDKLSPDTVVGAAAFSPDNRFIAAGMNDGAIALWSRDGRPLPATARHDSYVELLAFSSDGRWLASAGDDNTIRVIDVATGSEIGVVALTADRATLLWWSPHGDQLIIDTERRFQITVAPRPTSAH
jgi:hypothetical protein